MAYNRYKILAADVFNPHRIMGKRTGRKAKPLSQNALFQNGYRIKNKGKPKVKLRRRKEEAQEMLSQAQKPRKQINTRGCVLSRILSHSDKEGRRKKILRFDFNID